MYQEFFQQPKDVQRNEKPIDSFAEGVQSLLYFQLSIGNDLPLDAILAGKQDPLWSDVNKVHNSSFFDSCEDFWKYLQSDKWKDNYGLKTRAAVFCFGYSKNEVFDLLNKGKFSELVVRATHLHTFFTNYRKVYENSHFNPNLLCPQKKTCPSL